jgi:hypothetical protein
MWLWEDRLEVGQESFPLGERPVVAAEIAGGEATVSVSAAGREPVVVHLEAERRLEALGFVAKVHQAIARLPEESSG